MKSTYDSFMRVFEKGSLGQKRQELIPSAYGQVLEIGSGTGVNLTYYDETKVDHIVFSDETINKVLLKKLDHFQMSHTIQEVNVENISYEDQSFDTVVVTLVFCSVGQVQKGLSELRRVLKDSGQLIFIEHVLPDHKNLAALFNAVTPVWKHLASGCHLNRAFLQSLDEADFMTREVSSFNQSAFVSGRAYKKV